MKIFWSERAKEDLDAVYEFYLPKSLDVAARFYNAIIDEIERLTKNPKIAPIDEYISTSFITIRSLVFLDGLYKVMYVADNSRIGIYRIWSCRKDPKGFIL